jgi:hypothetical protein
MYDRARRYLTDWLDRHPNDQEIKQMLDDFDRQVQQGKKEK